jgi:flagella basal body P-ring formation protein FlgA
LRKSILIAASAAALAFVAAFAAPVARASRVSLLPQVEVRGNSIFLSDLLPPDVPAPVRASAQGILIGLAPQPGSTRILDGSKIADLIGGASAVGEIDIPRQIVVRRFCRVITREEVVAAIRNALKHSGLPEPDLQPDDLRVFPSVTVSSNDARPQVHRIDFDETLNQARFLLSERGALPFLVTAQFRDSSLIQAATRESVPSQTLTADVVHSKTADLREAPASLSQALAAATDADQSRMVRLISGALVNATLVQGPTLVQAGKAATLFLNSGTMQMLLDVTTIDRGSLHQTVRVRLPGTGKVLRAEVVGERRLEATF